MCWVGCQRHWTNTPLNQQLLLRLVGEKEVKLTENEGRDKKKAYDERVDAVAGDPSEIHSTVGCVAGISNSEQ